MRLGQGEVQAKTSQDLPFLVRRLQHDPKLDVGEALWSLLLTQLHIVMRFCIYLQFPTQLWKLCKKFNEDGYLVAVEEFLTADSSFLDAGYSLPLRRQAEREGTHALATAFILSSLIQQEVEDIFKRSEASSLDVERKNKQDKKVKPQR